MVPHKNGKKTIFHKRDTVPKSTTNDFGSQTLIQGSKELIPDLDDMPQHIKNMCMKQNIPQQQSIQRNKMFQDLWYPAEVRGQAPFPHKDRRGLGFGQRNEPTTYYAVNTVSFSAQEFDQQQPVETKFDSSDEEEELILIHLPKNVSIKKTQQFQQYETPSHLLLN